MMFSKEYFKYLLTSNRYLLILVFFLFAFNAIGNTIKGLDLLLQGFLAVLFSFILPIIVFYHVHDKRAVDSYFALPVDRKRILATSILFCFLIVYAGIAIGILAFAYRSDGPFNTAFALLIMALAALVLGYRRRRHHDGCVYGLAAFHHFRIEQFYLFFCGGQQVCESHFGLSLFAALHGGRTAYGNCRQ